MYSSVCRTITVAPSPTGATSPGRFEQAFARKLLVLLSPLILCFSIMPTASEVEYEKYLCVTDRVVGFTSSYSGSISIPGEFQKFSIEIEKITLSATEKLDVEVPHDKDYCQKFYSSDKIEEAWVKWSV